MQTPTELPDPVKTTERSIEIMELLKEQDGMELQEIASETGIALSTVHRHLSTLNHHGFVVQSGSTYHVGLRFLEFGNFARKALDFFDITKEQADTLANETGEKIRLTTVENGMSVLLYRQMGDHPLRTAARIGKRQHLHQLAAGKAILASMPSKRVVEIIDRYGLPAKTENTITDREELFDKFETIREQQYGLNLGEAITGLNAIGSAIHDEAGDPVAALSISGPASRLSRDNLVNQMSEPLLSTIDEVEINMKHA